MKATEVLSDEHVKILAMLDVVQAAANRLRNGKEIPRDLIPNAVSFLRNFADKYHHGKEEGELFPAMEQRGVPKNGGPIGVMLAEHDQGRGYIRGMSEAADKYAAGDQTASAALIQNALDYVNLLRQHIAKEDNILYPMADHVLANGDQEKLSAAFARVEQTRFDPGERERYHALLAECQKIAASW